ncbi:protein of unknown function [Moritella yayanosii]|uniref:Uncharacterized protein n=1 Tax=Moritella yayanosii TaxID=69539 RepID=A0A330LNY1_9GAMM|nr:protein of unknown function [Moritella yayanosii]
MKPKFAPEDVATIFTGPGDIDVTNANNAIAISVDIIVLIIFKN